MFSTPRSTRPALESKQVQLLISKFFSIFIEQNYLPFFYPQIVFARGLQI